MLTTRILDVPRQSAAIDASADVLRQQVDEMTPLIEASAEGAPEGIDLCAKGIAAANQLEMARRLLWQTRDAFEACAAGSSVAMQAAGDAAVRALDMSAGGDARTRDAVVEAARSRATREVIAALTANVKKALSEQAKAVADGVVEAMRDWERELSRARLEVAVAMRSGLDLTAVLERERAASTFRAKGLAWAKGYWDELLRVGDDERARWYIDTCRPWLGEVVATPPAKTASARAAHGGRVDTGDDARDTGARLLRAFEKWEEEHAPAWLVSGARAFEIAKALVRELVGIDQRFMTDEQFRRTYLSLDMRRPDPLAVDGAWYVRRLPGAGGPGLPGYTGMFDRRQAARANGRG